MAGFLCPDSLMLREPELGPYYRLSLSSTHATQIAKWLAGALAKRFTYQVSK